MHVPTNKLLRFIKPNVYSLVFAHIQIYDNASPARVLFDFASDYNGHKKAIKFISQIECYIRRMYEKAIHTSVYVFHLDKPLKYGARQIVDQHATEWIYLCFESDAFKIFL